MDDRELDERIANLIDAEYIVKQFGLLDEKQKEELAQDISRFMYDRQADLRSPKNTYTPRFLWQGQDINHADIGRTLAVGHKGPTVPRIINLDTGFNAYLTQNDPQQLNIRSAGAGADCMFDYLVSSCFATLNGFSEGTQYTSLSGCTFYAYSTVQGAATAISALGSNENPVLFICPGTYAENVTFTGPSTNTVHIIGAGRLATQITGQTSAGTTLSHTTNATAVFTLENIGINVHNSAGAIGIGDGSGGSNWICRNVKVATNTNSNSIGVYTGVAASGLDWRFETCLFTGSGIAFADSGPDRTDVVWGNVVLVNCEVRSTVGALFANDGRLRAVGTQFACTTAIKNDSAFTSIDLDLEGCRFEGCTDGILATAGGGFNRLSVVGSKFNRCTTAIKTGTTANVWTTCIISSNNFQTDTATDVAIDDTSGCFSRSVIIGNTFRGYNANNEMIGLDTTDNEIGHNETDSGATLPDTHSVLLAGTFAPIGSPFVTVGNDATLTAERALVGGSGIDLTDGGANGNATLDLANLTQAWTQSGAFDIIQAGGGVGIGQATDSLSLVITSGTVTGHLGVRMDGVTDQFPIIFTQHSSTLATTIGPSMIMAKSRGSYASPLVVTSGSILGGFQFYGYDGSVYAAAAAIQAFVDGTPGAGDMPGRLGFYTSSDGSASGVERLRIDNAGNVQMTTTLRVGGAVGTSAATTADIRGAVTLDGVAAPSTPASDDGVLYNETGTDFLKYKEDNAAVYNLTHKHLWDAAVDVTTASTTVPPMLVGPMPNDGTITNVYAKLTDNKTNGATSSIFDIHKILLANANTDGQGTTIYTTQANRPTISNGNMYQAATAPDVTTFAAGDWFAIYVDQTGTTATFAVVGMHVRYT